MSRTTRQSNKNAHPGLPDVDEEVLSRPTPKIRRTKAQIAADNSAAAARKIANAEEAKLEGEKKARLVMTIAAMENKLDGDEKAKKEAAHPFAKKTVIIPLIEVDSRASKKSKSGSNSLNNKAKKVIPPTPDLEQMITSSDIEFLHGKKDEVKTKNVGEKNVGAKNVGAKKVKGGSRTAIADARRALAEMNTDLSGSTDFSIKRKADDDYDARVKNSTKRGKLDLSLATNKRKNVGHSNMRTKKARPAESSESDDQNSLLGNNENRNLPLAGFRPGWQPSKAAASPTIGIDSGAGDIGDDPLEREVDRFDYAADDSEDDTQEAIAVSARPPSKKDLKPLLKSGLEIKYQKPVARSLSSSSSHGSKPRLTFNNSSLPLGTIKRWQSVYLPTLYQYLGTLKNPWLLDDLLVEAQNIWDEVFPHIPETLAATGEPIYHLTKQRSYEWRGGFAAAATIAVQDFWNLDTQFASAESRANYVEWAIPAANEEPTPFTWADVDETGDEPVYRGAFQSPAVLATFSTHIASVSHLSSDLSGSEAEGALAMAAISVERAFRMWSTGVFVKPTKANGGPEAFTAAWMERTALYAADIEFLPLKTWTKIISAATEIVEAKKGLALQPITQVAKVPIRRRIIDADESE